MWHWTISVFYCCWICHSNEYIPSTEAVTSFISSFNEAYTVTLQVDCRGPFLILLIETCVLPRQWQVSFLPSTRRILLRYTSIAEDHSWSSPSRRALVCDTLPGCSKSWSFTFKETSSVALNVEDKNWFFSFSVSTEAYTLRLHIIRKWQYLIWLQFLPQGVCYWIIHSLRWQELVSAIKS